MASSQPLQVALKFPKSAIQMLVLAAAAIIAAPLLFVGTGLFSVSKAIRPGPLAPGRNATATSDLHRCGAPAPVAADRRTYVAGYDDRYFAAACINGVGQRVAISINSASSVLTWTAATEYNLKPNRLTFDRTFTSSFGTLKVAATKVPLLRVGDIEMRDFEILVAREGDLNVSFLGKDFLDRLKSYKPIDGHSLVMVPR